MTTSSTMHRMRTPVGILVLLILVALSGAPPASAGDSDVAKDAFGRIAPSGWDRADMGGAWETPTGTGALSVSNGKGRMSLHPGATSATELPTPAQPSQDMVVDVTADRAPTGGGQYISMVGRGTRAMGYRLTARVKPGGSVEVSLRRLVNGSSSVLAGTTLEGIVPSGAAAQLRMRMSLQGSAPTTLQAKVWRLGQPEPGNWALSTKDTNPSLPASRGGVGLVGYVSSSTINAPVLLQFDNFAVTTAPAPAAAAPPTSKSKPDAASTGVPSGVALKTLTSANRPYSKDTIYSDGSTLVINTPNAVYDGWQFDMFVEVKAPGVRITRSLLRGASRTSYSRGLLLLHGGAGNGGPASAVVEDSTMIPRAPSNLLDGVRGSNVTLRRVEISGTVDGVSIYGTTSRTDPNAGNVNIEDSWIHDLPHFNDSSHSDGSHNDGVQVIGGRNIRITGSRIDGSIHNAGVMITNGRNNVSNVTIANNWAASGACTVNVSDKNAGAITGLSMTGNVFTRGTTRNTDCAMIVTDATRAIATAAGNTWHNGSTPAPSVDNGG